MTLFAVPAAILGVLLSLIVLHVELASDAGAILGPVAQDASKIERANDRQLIIALVSGNPQTRNAAARGIAAWLTTQGLVSSVQAGPEALSSSFLNWLWERRFRLNPPTKDDLSIEGMSHRLAQARKALTQGSGMLIGDRLLRDPTGSFANLVGRLGSAPSGLRQIDGVWQSRDDTAAIVFVTLDDRPFRTAETTGLARQIRARAKEFKVESYLLGARIIAAEISTQTSQAASFAALAATGLLLAWLAWILRSGRRLLSTFLPLALGIASSTLVVQLGFGSVHVVALGFGGALTGLALDYPLHLLSHGKETRRQTERLVLIGAITTSVGFLALFGSGVPALMQTGLFVATGLAVAALSSRSIVPKTDAVLRAPPMERLVWRLPYKEWVEASVVIAGIAVIASAPAGSVRTLFEPPGQVDAVIARFAKMLPLPSGQHVIIVEGKNLDELLERQAALRPTLDAAVAQGALGRYSMLSLFMSAKPVIAVATRLPPEEFNHRAMEALRANGMVPGFASTQTDEYRAALMAPEISPEDLEAFPETNIIATDLRPIKSGWRERIQLFDPREPQTLSIAVSSAKVAGVEMFDVRQKIEVALIELRHRVATWLGLGALAAFAVLAIGLGDWRRAIRIALTTAAATAVTAATLTLSGGTLGVFQIVALTLIVGIGIDYGLFLSGREKLQSHYMRYRSVALCAGSTLIAFSIMALASVRILQEVGLTVSLGVIVVVCFNLAQPQRKGTGAR
jgi:predicted exporter